MVLIETKKFLSIAIECVKIVEMTFLAIMKEHTIPNVDHRGRNAKCSS